jgi:segregation and condensation protein A
MDYQFRLDAFTGPLDLLLHLVKRHEVDVLDIPVAEIARQFQEYVEVIRQIDFEAAGDFLVMATTLMEIKSRLVLPAEAPAEGETAEEADPRRELVRQLLEYRKFKGAAAALEERAEQQAGRLPRQAVEEPAPPGGPPPVRPVELWDLVSAFGRLMRETLALEPKTVVADETPQHVYMDTMYARLTAAGRLTFRQLFDPPHHRARLVGLFLAMLELIKQRRIAAEQPDAFGEIWLTPAA